MVDDPPVDHGRLRDLSLSVDLRFWLLRELQEGLLRSAALAPMVIAIDDLQWADPVTFLLLKLRSRQARASESCGYWRSGQAISTSPPA